MVTIYKHRYYIKVKLLFYNLYICSDLSVSGGKQIELVYILLSYMCVPNNIMYYTTFKTKDQNNK